MKTRYQRGIYTAMFIAALFIIAKIRTQPKCPSKGEWIKKMRYTYKYTQWGIIHS